jgi:hypothetical protein
MPELHGKPFKTKLYAEIAQLKRDIWNERKEHMNTRRALRYSRARVEELEAQLARVKQQTENALREIDSDIGPAVIDRLLHRRTG